MNVDFVGLSPWIIAFIVVLSLYLYVRSKRLRKK